MQITSSCLAPLIARNDICHYYRLVSVVVVGGPERDRLCNKFRAFNFLQFGRYSYNSGGSDPKTIGIIHRIVSL